MERCSEVQRRFAQRQATPGRPKVEDVAVDATTGIKALKHVLFQVGRERAIAPASSPRAAPIMAWIRSALMIRPAIAPAHAPARAKGMNGGNTLAKVSQ